MDSLQSDPKAHDAPIDASTPVLPHLYWSHLITPYPFFRQDHTEAIQTDGFQTEIFLTRVSEAQLGPRSKTIKLKWNQTLPINSRWIKD